MAECKHELKDLVGMADGIHCRACGQVFKSLDETSKEEKPKRKKSKKEVE